MVEENGGVIYVLKIDRGLRESDEEGWRYTVDSIKALRNVKLRKYVDRSVGSDDAMVLWFMSPPAESQIDRETRSKRVLEPEDLRPNTKALEFHKTACLIWRMTGGAEE